MSNPNMNPNPNFIQEFMKFPPI